MTTFYWNDWYMGWGWVLWFGVFFLLIAGVWNWGYVYTTNQKNHDVPKVDPLDILKARLARGEIEKEEYQILKKELKEE